MSRLASWDYKGDPQGALRCLLETLLAVQWLHRNNHWNVRGQRSYGDHLLFQRIYESIDDEVDGLAEKMIGIFGPCYPTVAGAQDVFQGWYDTFPSSTMEQHSCNAELYVIRSFVQVYDGLKEAGHMTLGLDDFLMSAASNHETNLYLLRQSNYDVRRKYASSMTAERFFFDNPNKRETREFAQSGSITNDYNVARTVALMEEAASYKILKKEVDETPPTVEEIMNMPGSDQFSTLSRFIVETEERTSDDVPDGYSGVSKHPKIARFR